MRKIILGIIITAVTTAKAQSPKTASQIDSLYGFLYKTERFNGTVLYAEKGKVLFKKAYGVTAPSGKIPLTTSSSFNLASISKQFFAMGIMILKDRGLLAFDDKVTRFIPELPYPDVTIRNLLTHTSGIPEYFDLFMRNRSPLDTLDNEKMIALFGMLKPALEFQTGTKWKYSNTNYVLLASVIERISKQSAASFLAQNIFSPLKLNNTYCYHLLMRSIPENHVMGMKGINGRVEMNDLTVLDGVVGDGNIYSSVEDLLIWDQSLYKPKIVKPATWAEALQPVRLKDGSNYPYGFGWFIDTTKVQHYWHTGGWGGFGNIILRDEKNKRAMIALCSNSKPWGIHAARYFFDAKPFEIPKQTLIRNVLVADGTGGKLRKASVRIEGKNILSVGDLIPLEGESVVDGNGQVLAPGFIDTHSHLGGSLSGNPDGLAAISQGITTIVEGQDGESYLMDSLNAMIKSKPTAINVASYTGHATLREMTMGENNVRRRSTPSELERMNVILKNELDKGSLGLSSGLEYEEGFYSDYNEVISLAKTAAAEHSRYISHIRSEDIRFDEALDEIISIGREAKIPVQISHFKISILDRWGQAPEILAKLQQVRTEGVDITADCYPYVAWHSTLRVLFPQKDFNNLESAQYTCDHLIDPAGSILARFKPEPAYAGKSISEVAVMRKQSPAQSLIDLVAMADSYRISHPNEGGVESIMGKSMSDEDVKNLLAWPYTNICTDGTNGGHPRGYGSFTRVLSKYVREEHAFGLEEAIRKMTSLAAEHTGIRDRGIIAPGMRADLVLFDPSTVKDNSTVQNSKALSTGILNVWVNGTPVYDKGKFLGSYPGELLTR